MTHTILNPQDIPTFMTHGLDKCKTLSIVRGKIQQIPHELSDNTRIEAMTENETYKYLGISQSTRIKQQQMKIELEKEFTSRLNKILKTNLNSKYTIKVINTFAVPVIIYSLGVVSWSKTDILRLERKIRTSMTK